MSSMSNLFSFYISLLSIELAVFGLISAAILVFIQLIYNNFSYKNIKFILTNKILILYTILSSLDIIFTSAAAYILVFKESNVYIANEYYGLACLALLFISIFLFIGLLVKNIEYLQPHRAILLLTKHISNKDIKKFLWKKYGIESMPRPWIYIEGLFEKKSKKQIKLEKEQEEKNYKEFQEKVKKTKKETANSEDPLSVVLELDTRFIKQADLKSLEETKVTLVEISDRFFQSLPKKTDGWSLEKDLSKNFTNHLISMLKSLLEIAQKEALESAEKNMIDISHEVAKILNNNNAYRELDLIFEFWKEIADKKINESSLIFQEIINAYWDLGVDLFEKVKKDKDEKQRDLNESMFNVFRYISWLGERLLSKTPIEESPLMGVIYATTDYDVVYNSLLDFSYKYQKDMQYGYPRIYFDALYVIFMKLLDIYQKNKNYDIGNNIFSICWAIYSFGEDAITANNSRGASLAAFDLTTTYKELKKKGLDEKAKECMGLLVELGIQAAGKKEELEKVELFMGKTFKEYVIDEIIKSGEDVSGDVNEGFIKSMGGDHDGRWEFIVNLGMRMGTNFGFMFDETTGELYSKDDPRRR